MSDGGREGVVVHIVHGSNGCERMGTDLISEHPP